MVQKWNDMFRIYHLIAPYGTVYIHFQQGANEPLDGRNTGNPYGLTPLSSLNLCRQGHLK